MSNKDTAMALVNNFWVASNKIDKAPKAKFFIKKLSEKTGQTQQGLIVSLIMEGVQACAALQSYIPEIEKEWNKVQK